MDLTFIVVNSEFTSLLDPQEVYIKQAYIYIYIYIYIYKTQMNYNSFVDIIY